jgi:hypothetical protein
MEALLRPISEAIVRWENLTENVRVRPRADEMLAAARDLQ